MKIYIPDALTKEIRLIEVRAMIVAVQQPSMQAESNMASFSAP